MEGHDAVVLLRSALDSADWPEAARLLFRHWGSLLEVGITEMDRALLLIPPEIGEQDPRWFAIQCIRFRQPRIGHRVELPSPPAPFPEERHELLDIARSDGLSDALGTAIALMVAHRISGGFPQASFYADIAESLIMSGRITRPADIREQIPVGLLQIGITRMFGSNLSGARSSLIEAYERAPESSRAHIGAGAASKLALIAALGGDTLEAERWRKRMPGHPERSEWLRSQLGLNLGLLDLAKGITTLDQASATESLHSLADTGSLDPQWLMQNFEPSWSSVIHHVLARHDLLWGDRRAALARLRRHTEESSRWLGDGSTARMLLRADHVDLLLSVGATERARAVLLRSPERPELVATRARLDLLTGRIEAALRRSRDALDEGSAAPSALLQLLVIQAAAHLQLGDSAQADAAFAQAARTIHATGSAFGLIAAPRTVVLELAERARFVDVEPFLSRLPDVFPDRLEIIELSTMERRVLDALGRGYGAPVIAQQFHVSPNTVKSHTHRIYRKLGVTSRSEAVSRATELGLISPQ